MPTQPVVYTHPDCSYSDELKEELDAAGTAYQEIDLSVRPEEIPKVLELTDGERITPVMVVGDEVTIGHNGLG